MPHLRRPAPSKRIDATDRPDGGRRRLRRLLVAALALTTGGCGLLGKVPRGKHDTTTSYHDAIGMQIEYPQVTECAQTPPKLAAEGSMAPFSLEDPATLPAYDLTLEEAIRMAVQESPVLRNIGGTVVTAPQGTSTVYDPGLASASPTQGTEAALAAFDAQYTQQLFFASVDQPGNFFPDNPGAGLFFVPVNDRRQTTFSNDLTKQTAQGASFSLRHVVNYDLNKTGLNLAFRSAFSGYLEAEWRQPLMQGAGTTFNRIAGPSRIPGQYNGVLIARLNEDVALTDFEDALVQLVADVEQAYWDLVVAYRVLDAQVRGRGAAQQTFQFQQVRLEVGSGRSDEEAQARSQFYQFQAQVEASLGGPSGLYALEQQLRYLIGLPASDGRLIRPTTEPMDVKVVFDWDSALGQAIARRVEIRRQMLAVKRRELELTAARLNVRPRLDLLAQYRWRGLGNHLIGDTTGPVIDNSGLIPSPNDSSNLYGNILGGRYQEGQVGFEMNFPVGLRAASVAVAHARLNLRRERALLDETELRVSHDLAAAARQVDLTHQLLETNYNRFVADLRQVEVLDRRYREGNDNINFLLQAQRQVVTSASDFYQSLGNYNLSVRDLHRQKGSLLAYNQVQLAEGPWAPGAANDAYEVGRFLTPRRSPEKVSAPRPLTTGLFDPAEIQNTGPIESAGQGGVSPATGEPSAGDVSPPPTPEPMTPTDPKKTPTPVDDILPPLPGGTLPPPKGNPVPPAADPLELPEPLPAPPAKSPTPPPPGNDVWLPPSLRKPDINTAALKAALRQAERGKVEGLISFGPSWER